MTPAQLADLARLNEWLREARALLTVQDDGPRRLMRWERNTYAARTESVEPVLDAERLGRVDQRLIDHP